MPERRGHITNQINRKLIELESHLVAARTISDRIRAGFQTPQAAPRDLVAWREEKRKHLDAGRKLLADLTQLEEQARKAACGGRR